MINATIRIKNKRGSKIREEREKRRERKNKREEEREKEGNSCRDLMNYMNIQNKRRS